MVDSRIEVSRGRVSLYIGGVRMPACAYITYFDERSHCEDFAGVGVEIYSLCASFSGLPLNSVTGYSPLFGIFDVKDAPDYSQFDRNVRQIIRACPTAKIFPRVRVSMPAWWIEEHPDHTCLTPSGRREALFSDLFRETGALMLREFIAHVQSSDYADHVIGYQIAGGGTEEWFHYDVLGSLSTYSEKKFNEFLHAHYPGEYTKTVPVPDYKLLQGREPINDPDARRYMEFSCLGTAETVAHFARIAKECVNYRQIIGVFFGYVQTIIDPLRGSLGMAPLLDNPDIDFFCSPVSYVNMRALGMDWAEHCAGESIKHHGKLYFIENDIRTCLSKVPNECRPGIDPEGKYTSRLWLGPDTVEGSVSAMRKAYARQLTHANAMWWFDMWGGWYDNEELMEEAKRSLSLLGELTESDRPTTRASLAVLFDEFFTCRVGGEHPFRNIQKTVHDLLGNVGVTYDAFLTGDYREAVHYDGVLFPFPESLDCEETVEIKRYLTEQGIPYVQLTDGDTDVSAEELRARLKRMGVFCYCDSGDVVYHGNGFFAVHAASEGMKEIRLPNTLKLTPLDGNREEFCSDRIELFMKQYETRLFRATEADNR